MTNELLFSRGDSPGIIDALIEAIPQGWELWNGKLEAPVSLIDSGAAVAGFTLFLNDRSDVKQPIAVSWQGALEAATAVFGGWQRPGNVSITSRGNNAYFALQQAWQIARPYIEMGYHGSLHFGHVDHGIGIWGGCTLYFETKETAGGPPVIKLWWDTEAEEDKYVHPLLAKCRELGLNEVHGEAVQPPLAV